MASSSDKSNKAIRILSIFEDVNSIIDNINNKSRLNLKLDARLPIDLSVSEDGKRKRNLFLSEETGIKLDVLSGEKPFSDFSQLEGNIENYIGMTLIPTGVIGPLRVVGSAAKGDFYIPLATSEGVLVASYHRGAKACYLAGGVTSICLVEGVQRSPLFKFNNISELGLFIVWVLKEIEMFKAITEKTSRFAKLFDMKSNIE
jgi:hydroxymethylglutaryl-CoA reductase (NADPH)